jgi:hypothetical protein
MLKWEKDIKQFIVQSSYFVERNKTEDTEVEKEKHETLSTKYESFDGSGQAKFKLPKEEVSKKRFFTTKKRRGMT